jgi:thioredoxin-dependent peroxiredoxin
MNQREGLVTMRGNPVVLTGDELNIGDMGPEFTVVGQDLKPVRFSDFRGNFAIIYSVPSLDTPVCDATARRFNKEATNLADDIVVLTISMDLPFAQARWRGAAGINRVITLSDHREASFGTAYGVLIKDLRLLARAVFAIDREGMIRYIELVKEIGDEPDFDAVLKTVKELA